MIYSFLADATVILHLTFILFVVFGGLMVFRWKWIFPFHLLTAIWGVLIEFFSWVCPLTPLENYFREQAGLNGYSGGFVEHYIVPIVYPAGLNSMMQFSLGILVILINLLVYGIYLFRRQKNRR